jgi:redox-sensitive bicupin YhaK (pirin superfamily)
MKRKDFIKKSAALSAIGLSSPLILKANKQKKISTYDKLKNQVGFNHLPNNEMKTMNSVVHKANTRGHADHGWLKANHSFSFANYYNPERMNFGVIRVLNDDSIAPKRGFGTHPHDNMEIITIPLEGDLKHQDNMGNGTVIKNGDIQVMSAGTGITHSEFNANSDSHCKLLQIWLFPNKKNVTPRYDQIAISSIAKKNKLYQILSPNKNDQGVWIHQNAWFHIGEYILKSKEEYVLRSKENGIYFFVIEGEVNINDKELSKRDGMGIWDIDQISFEAKANSKILLMEVPLTIN